MRRKSRGAIRADDGKTGRERPVCTVCGQTKSGDLRERRTEISRNQRELVY